MSSIFPIILGANNRIACRAVLGHRRPSGVAPRVNLDSGRTKRRGSIAGQGNNISLKKREKKHETGRSTHRLSIVIKILILCNNIKKITHTETTKTKKKYCVQTGSESRSTRKKKTPTRALGQRREKNSLQTRRIRSFADNWNEKKKEGTSFRRRTKLQHRSLLKSVCAQRSGIEKITNSPQRLGGNSRFAIFGSSDFLNICSVLE